MNTRWCRRRNQNARGEKQTDETGKRSGRGKSEVTYAATIAERAWGMEEGPRYANQRYQKGRLNTKDGGQDLRRHGLCSEPPRTNREKTGERAAEAGNKDVNGQTERKPKESRKF